MPDVVTVPADDVRLVADALNRVSVTFGPYLGAVLDLAGALEACGRMLAAVMTQPADAMPEDPVSGIDSGAITTHEMMQAHVRAGFDRQEAFMLTLAHVQAVAAGSALRGPR